MSSTGTEHEGTTTGGTTTGGTTPATTTEVGFAITVQLGNPPQNVTITAPDLTDIATKGLYFALPPGTTITLGTLRTLITWLNGKLPSGVQIPTDTSGWPTQLATIFNGVLDTVVTVERFAVAQDPKPTPTGDYPPLRFDLEVTAAPATPISIFDMFSVVGGGIGVIRSYAGAPNTWTPVVTGGTTPAALPSGQTTGQTTGQHT